jgi:hypothetical protein
VGVAWVLGHEHLNGVVDAEDGQGRLGGKADHLRERERVRERVCVCVRESERVCVCV